MIRWMAEHKVAANLLMLILLIWGGMSTLNLKQELFLSSNWILSEYLFLPRSHSGRGRRVHHCPD